MDIETKRLILRFRSRPLIDEVLQQSSEAQRKFFGLESSEQLEETITRVKKTFNIPYDNHRNFDFILKDTDQVIGSAGYHNWFKDHNRAEVGYSLHKPFRGKGYMLEGMQSIIKLGFDEMNLNRIEACISPNNQPSLNLINRLGFKKEGLMKSHYKIGGKYEDSIMFALLKEDCVE